MKLQLILTALVLLSLTSSIVADDPPLGGPYSRMKCRTQYPTPDTSSCGGLGCPWTCENWVVASGQDNDCKSCQITAYMTWI